MKQFTVSPAQNKMVWSAVIGDDRKQIWHYHYVLHLINRNRNAQGIGFISESTAEYIISASRLDIVMSHLNALGIIQINSFDAGRYDYELLVTGKGIVPVYPTVSKHIQRSRNKKKLEKYENK